MKRIAKRILSLMLVLMLSVCSVLVYSGSAEAAEQPSISITPVVSNSYSEQIFNVYVSTSGASYKTSVGSGALNAGSNTLVFNTSDTITLTVVAPYTTESGGTTNMIAMCDSINAYYVYASCVGSDGAKLGGQTLTLSKYNQPEAVFQAPASFDAGESVYVTSNPSLVFNYGDGNKSITYTKVAKEDRAYSVNYVDENNTLLQSESGVMKYGETRTLSAPATIEKDGSTYKLKTTGTYDVTFENVQSQYTFEYIKQIPAPETPYEITINLNDENGALLYSFKQGLDVNGSVNIELPKTYEINFKKYQLAEGEPTAIVREFASTDATTYNVSYVLSEESAPYDITVNYVDYESGVVLSALTAQVTPDGEPFIYDISTKNSLVIDETEYQVVAGQGNNAGQIVHTYGDTQRTYSVYYTSKQVENPASYPVTMRYICVNDNEVLSEEAQDVEFNSSVTFEEAPETLEVDGKEYIRLNGQEGERVHAYSSTQDSYSVFYRDASIPVEEEPEVVVQTITQYVTREDGTVEQNADGTTVPETVEIATVTDENGEETTYNEEGQEVEVEDGQIVVIEEEETPLADASQLAEKVATSSMTLVILGGLAVLAVILFFILGKKKNEQE